MTVSEIVKDLLENNMINAEAALVLINAEVKARLYDNSTKNSNKIFQPYHGVSNGNTSNPYYVSTNTNDIVGGTNNRELTTGAIELLKTK